MRDLRSTSRDAPCTLQRQCKAPCNGRRAPCDETLSTLQPAPGTLQPAPSTLRHAPGTLRHAPSTLRHAPSTLQHPPSTLQAQATEHVGAAPLRRGCSFADDHRSAADFDARNVAAGEFDAHVEPAWPAREDALHHNN